MDTSWKHHAKWEKSDTSTLGCAGRTPSAGVCMHAWMSPPGPLAPVWVLSHPSGALSPGGAAWEPGPHLSSSFQASWVWLAFEAWPAQGIPWKQQKNTNRIISMVLHSSEMLSHLYLNCQHNIKMDGKIHANILMFPFLEWHWIANKTTITNQEEKRKTQRKGRKTFYFNNFTSDFFLLFF